MVCVQWASVRLWHEEVHCTALLTALCLDTEAVLESLVGVCAGDDFWVGAAHVHIPLAVDDVAAIALQPMCYEEERTERGRLEE